MKKDTKTKVNKSNQETKETKSNKNEQVFLDKLYAFFILYTQMVERSVLRFLMVTKKSIIKFYNRFLKRILRYLGKHFKHFKRSFSGVNEFIKGEFSNTALFFKQAYTVLKNGYNKNPKANFLTKLWNMIRAFGYGVKNNTRYFKTVFNYLLPIASIFLIVYVVNYVRGMNIGVEVGYKGQTLGYIDSEEVYQNAENKLQARMIYRENDDAITNIPSFAVKVVDKNLLKSDSQLTDAMIQASADDIIKATGVVIDGKFYGAVKDISSISKYLSETLDKYKEKYPNTDVKFTKDILTEQGIYLTSNIVDENSILSMLKEESQQDVYYTVQEGDTPFGIAEKNGITLNELVAMNSDITTNCLVGRQVLLKKAKPFLSVSVTRTETYDVAIAYTTKTIQSASLYKGTKKVTQEGANGLNKVVAQVEYVNDIEVSRNIISTTVLSEPVEKIITEGTKALPSSPAYSGPVSGYGLIWPVTGSYISTYYGQRYFNGVHTGLDLAFRGGGYGRPIYAAHSGTVVKSGYNGSYGNLIVIQSGGLQTWYAHCSSLNYSVGQTVSQGQVIARVGSTGLSTGAHLHFMVYINGVRQNPLNFLPR